MLTARATAPVRPQRAATRHEMLPSQLRSPPIRSSQIHRDQPATARAGTRSARWRASVMYQTDLQVGGRDD